MDNNFEHRTAADVLGEYAALLWHWAWLLILCTLLAGGIAYWRSSRQTPIYAASTMVSMNSASATQSVDYYQLTTNEQLAATYARTMTTSLMLDKVAKRLGLNAFPFTASVQVQPIQDTQIMIVNVLDTDPVRAAQIANTLVSVFADKIYADQTSRYADSKKNLSDQMASMQQQITESTNAITALNQKILETTNAMSDMNDQIQKDTKALVSSDTIDAERTQLYQLESTRVQYQSQLAPLQTTQQQYQNVYNSIYQSLQNLLFAEAQSTSIFVQEEPARPSRFPISPRPTRDALLAALVGLALSVGGIFLVDFLDNTIRDPEEITRKWGVPVLGTILSYEHDENSLITALQPRSPITEAFRSLRTNLNFASFNNLAHTILITSPSPEDGKTTVTANLANVIAQSGRTVVALDADMRRPRLHRVFNMSNRFGLADQFIHTRDRFNGSLKQSEVPGLQVLTSGNLPPNPAELLGSEKMTQILAQLSSQFDTTIVDAPPLLLVTDALVLAPRVDGVILVIKPTVTKRSALKNALDQLKHVNANLIGVVLNDVKMNRSRYYHYSGYYYNKKYSRGYHYSEKEEEINNKPEAPSLLPQAQKPAQPDDIKKPSEENTEAKSLSGR